MSGATVVVTGIMGQTPVGGVAWQGLHYLEGLRRLGHDVYYVEDTEMWPYDPRRNEVTADCRFALEHLARIMALLGLSDCWAYRAGAQSRAVFGMEESALTALWQRTDALVNVTGSTWLREEHLEVPVRIYVETDPGIPQVEVAQGSEDRVRHLAAHTHHFTYGENVGRPDCLLPVTTFRYRPTRQPVVLDWWPPSVTDNSLYTTVTTWQQPGRDIAWRGDVYRWSKHQQFLGFLHLPRLTGARFEVALAPGEINLTELSPAVELLEAHDWRVVDALALSTDVQAYRRYVIASRAEFTVAKDQYVRLRTGWFSDRSACYLAAGKPVVTQDTGFGVHLPTGMGLLSFRTVEDAVTAIAEVEADYGVHAGAAREIATEYFAAEKVLADLLADAGV